MVTTQSILSTPEDLHSVTYTSPEKLKYYAKTVESYEPIGKISTHCDVFRIISKPALLGLISTREFTDVICNYRCNGAYITYCTQAPKEVLETLPMVPNAVRGRDVNVLSAFAPSASEGEATMVMDLETEVGGSLPPWMVRKALPQTLQDTAKMTRQMAAKFPTWSDFAKTADTVFLRAD